MRRLAALLFATLPCTGCSLWSTVGPPPPTPVEVTSDWTFWRGPQSTGFSAVADPPTTWSAQDHVQWRVPLEGRGHSSPVIHGDTLFLTAAVPTGPAMPPRYDGAPGSHDNLPVTHRQQFVVEARDVRDGSIRWRSVVREAEPDAQGHATASLASPSPVTDGERIIASFGSQGIFALDLEGNTLWSRNLPTLNTKHAHGEGASPLLLQGLVVLSWDHEGESFVTALDATTGEERWWNPRDEPTSWSTPIGVEVDGRWQVIVAGSKRLRAYDLASGDEVWSIGGFPGNTVASPVMAGDYIIAGASYGQRTLVAIDPAGARGPLEGTPHVIWRRTGPAPYVPSPLVTPHGLWFLDHYQAMLWHVDPRTGKDLGPPLRLHGIRDVYASPVAAAGRIYVTGRSGTTVVVRDGPRAEILATNPLGVQVDASAALTGRSVILRAHGWLYALGPTADTSR